MTYAAVLTFKCEKCATKSSQFVFPSRKYAVHRDLSLNLRRLVSDNGPTLALNIAYYSVQLVYHFEKVSNVINLMIGKSGFGFEGYINPV